MHRVAGRIAHLHRAFRHVEPTDVRNRIGKRKRARAGLLDGRALAERVVQAADDRKVAFRVHNEVGIDGERRGDVQRAGRVKVDVAVGGIVAAAGERVAGERRRLARGDAAKTETVEKERAGKVVRARQAVQQREEQRRRRAAAGRRRRAIRPQRGGGPVARDRVRRLLRELRQDAFRRRSEPDVVKERGHVLPPTLAGYPHAVRPRRQPQEA